MPSILAKGEWCEAPPARRPPKRKSQWDEVLEALRAKPGEWMQFKDQSRSVLYFVQQRYLDLPALVIRGQHYRNARGRRRATILMCWQPKGAWAVDTDPGTAPEPEPAGDAA